MTDSSASPVVTRFAPSPTGYLHIGGARTALFNWLYARAKGGKFLIRVEDTDRERSTDAAVKAIFDGLDWLNLKGDEEPVFQSTSADRHRAVVADLLASGRAYRCFMTADELEAAREAAREAGHALRSLWRDRDDGDASLPHVVRFRGPLEGDVVVEDAVQGAVRWNAKDLDDLVLLRSDGAPTYNLAVVADDHDMGVTHVIRGDDHLNNAARQSLIYDALDWPRPTFAHIPLIHGPDGAKLSKRHGAQAVHEYADMGYLPEAMRNYLARLGWSHGDDELFSDEDAIAWFDLSGINKAPARLDFDKLAHVNAHWIRQADDARLTRLVAERLNAAGDLAEGDEARILAATPFIKGRAKTLIELVEQTGFARLRRPLTLDDKAKSLLAGETSERLTRLGETLSALSAWDTPTLDTVLKGFAESEGVGFGKVGPPLRAALTAGSTSPDMAATLAALGREEALGRLEDALSAFK